MWWGWGVGRPVGRGRTEEAGDVFHFDLEFLF